MKILLLRMHDVKSFCILMVWGCRVKKLAQYWLRVQSKNQCSQLGWILIKYTIMDEILLMLNMCPNLFMMHEKDAGNQENTSRDRHFLSLNRDIHTLIISDR